MFSRPYTYGSASRYLGMLAATLARWEESEQHFQNAVAMNAKLGARPWLAHTQHDYAVMLMAQGRPNALHQAAALLNEACAITRELGMRALDERVSSKLVAIAAQPSSAPAYPNDLSPREVEVLCLLATGKSNRDIAEALFISLNTVATHVRNILTKTKSGNRTEAATFAMSHGLTSHSPLGKESG
jgi:DNA-binding NarL/FixJ family response regulator